VDAIVREIDPKLSIHDFRMVPGVTHSNLIFDMAVPYECRFSREELEEKIRAGVHGIDETYYTVITFDRI